MSVPSPFPGLPPALAGKRSEHHVEGVGRVSWYEDGCEGIAAGRRPLLLVHSVNAAASAYEVKPLYDHYRRDRPVFAVDLPGYGFSDRSDRFYTPQLMCEAIDSVRQYILRRFPGAQIDVLALSLGCEFVARIAATAPQGIATVALVSPTGFNRKTLRNGPAGTTRGIPFMLALLNRPAYRRQLFGLLTRRNVIRYFLQRTWGAKSIDEGMVEYDYLTTRPPGAEYAPLHFLSGYLFSADSGTLYRDLAMPVWAVHGVRGDFVDYRGLEQLAASENWTVEIMQTGALPHFERLEEFVVQYETWLAGVR